MDDWPEEKTDAWIRSQTSIAALDALGAAFGELAAAIIQTRVWKTVRRYLPLPAGSVRVLVAWNLFAAMLLLAMVLG